MNKCPKILPVCLAGTLLSPIPFAAAAPALEEVIVTARKRIENLQDIPVSVTAFNSETLGQRDLRSLEELAGSTVGLLYENYNTSGLSAAPTIRGMSQTFATAREQNTSVFLDGIYLQRQSMLNPGLVDMERVEVVKGPQSALYGRNAFAGAINYVTKKPTAEWSGNVGVTFGNGEREDYRLAVSGPIVEDVLLFRAGINTSEFDGHTENDHPLANLGPGGDNTEGDLGGWDDQVASLSLRWFPTAGVMVDLGYYKSDSKREPQPFYNLDGARQNDMVDAENTLNCLDTATNVRLGPITSVVTGNHAYCGEFPKTPVFRNDLNDLGLAGDILVDPRSFAVNADTELLTLKLEWEFNNDLALDYLYGYTEHTGKGTGVQAGAKSVVGDGLISGISFVPGQGVVPSYTDATTFNSNPEEELEAISHEIKLSWIPDGPLSVRGGLYYSKVEDASWNVFWFVDPCDSAAACIDSVENASPALPGDFPPGTGHGLQSNLKAYEDEVYAAYAEMLWDINERWTLGIEGRYTKEDKTFEQFTSSFGVEAPLESEDTFEYFTPRVTLQYQSQQGNLLYANLGTGVKTGGFNTYDPEVNPSQAIYDEETNWALELGSKNLLLDGDLVINGSLYYIEWEDQQGTESADDPNPFASDVIGNIGDVEIFGIEIETIYELNDNFSVDAGYTWNDPEFKSAIYSPAVADENSSFGCDDTVCPSNGDVSGNILQRTAEQQATLGLNYRTTIQDWNLALRWDANYRSKMYATPLNLAHNGSRTISNASAIVNNDNWEIVLWGKNIFDEEYVANSFVLPSFSSYIVALGSRRTYGLNVNYNF